MAQVSPGQPPAEGDQALAAGAEAEEAPIGTLTILLLYLMVIIGLWGTAYLTLLQRG